jgi:fructokinase
MLEAWDLELVILTCGATGAWMVTSDDSSYVDAPLVEVVSTVGAGDSFTAAAVMGYLNGNALDDVNRHAARVAAYVCTQRGAVPPLPDHLANRFTTTPES